MMSTREIIPKKGCQSIKIRGPKTEETKTNGTKCLILNEEKSLVMANVRRFHMPLSKLFFAKSCQFSLAK
jgi:hypothetical protein